MFRSLVLIFLLLAAVPFTRGEVPGEGKTAEKRAAGSNGVKKLQARRYDEVAYATAHNAMSNSAEGWLFPNEAHGLTRQLSDGVRAFMLDVHDKGGKP